MSPVCCFSASKNAIIAILLSIMLLSGCAGKKQLSSIEQAIGRQAGYLGAVFKPHPEYSGLIVERLLPGPLLLTIRQYSNFDISKHILTHINDTAISIDNLQTIVNSYYAGDEIRLEFLSLDNKLSKSFTLTMTLGARSAWQGPISKYAEIKADDQRPHYLPDANITAKHMAVISEAIDQNQLSENVDALKQLFLNWEAQHRGFHSLSRVNYPFQSPDNLLALEETITQPLTQLQLKPQTIFQEIAKNLDLTLPAEKACSEADSQWENFHSALLTSQQQLQHAFRHFSGTEVNELQQDMAYFLSELSSLRTFTIQEQPSRSLNAINASMKLDFNALLFSAHALSCYLDSSLKLAMSSTDSGIPASIKAAIEGETQAIKKIENSWVVYGGTGDNTYDMSVIDVVYDPDGNDTYSYNQSTPLQVKLVIDNKGTDKYVSDENTGNGGWFGISIIVDHSGNDEYLGHIASNASGVMGIGIIVDHSGEDYYQANHFSNGAGIYGAGILLDLGQETDNYESINFSQGFGGPRGFGMIYEHAGNELYRTNQQTPSVYGTPSVYASYSQGFGFGLRKFDSGGIGVIYDNAGNDRYEGGEFSQAGAYYWGLGILHDERGRDLYYGNRYSQGFGVHQATGILVDRSGNDSYWSMTAACQGAAWDVAMGLLLDEQGQDHYHGDSLCQGSAAMQAMAWLIDLQGDDHYSSSSPISQGNSGENTYHFDADSPVYSWSVLLDMEGQDHYSNNFQNNSTKHNLILREQQPAKSQRDGLFIDH